MAWLGNYSRRRRVEVPTRVGCPSTSICRTRMCLKKLVHPTGCFHLYDIPHLPGGPCRPHLLTLFVFCMHGARFARAANGPSTRQQPAQAGARSTPASAPPAGGQQRGASSAASSSSSPHVGQAAGQAAQQNQRKAPAPQRQAPRSQQHQHPSQV